ncbi:hypothetical protein OQA88_9054 [Cercophora sp. LCS_1]
MRWSRNPFFKPTAPILPGPGPGPGPDPDSTPASDTETIAPPPDPSSIPTTHLLRPTPRLTPHQILYIFVLDGLGAMILSGGINLAIAYAMYTTSPPPVRLFQLPNTLAGDAAVTIILQSIITWLVELVLVNRDLSKGSVAPLGFVPQPTTRALRWFMFLDRREAKEEKGLGHWVKFLASQVLRAFLVAVVCFAVFWGPCVGCLMRLGRRSGGDWEFDATWTPQVFKLVLGGLLGLVQTPAFVVFWLVRAGWALQTNLGEMREVC